MQNFTGCKPAGYIVHYYSLFYGGLWKRMREVGFEVELEKI